VAEELKIIIAGNNRPAYENILYGRKKTQA